MTITTKELRRNLQHVHHAVRRGVHVQITFYGALWGVLIPAREMWERLPGNLREDHFRDVATFAPDLLDLEECQEDGEGRRTGVEGRQEDAEGQKHPAGDESGVEQGASPSPGRSDSSRATTAAPTLPPRPGEGPTGKPLFAVCPRPGSRQAPLPLRHERMIRCAAPDSGYLLTESAVVRYHMGDEEALAAFTTADSLAMSAYTHMQLISNRYLRRYSVALEKFLDHFDVQRLDLDSSVTHRALTLMELFGYLSRRSIGLYPEEAIVAATALTTGLTVLATEVGRYAQIPNLKVAELTSDGVFPVISRSDSPPIGPNRLQLNGPYMVGSRW
jgi:predicted nucleic acid-binding protein